VVLRSLHDSRVVAEADFTDATTPCLIRKCHPIQGSNVLVIVDDAKPMDMYEIVLAQGTCVKPRKERILARFLAADGARAYVETPLPELIGGTYVMLFRRGDPPYGDQACGRIERTWPW
jgi:hypothetical protein